MVLVFNYYCAQKELAQCQEGHKVNKESEM